MRWCQGGVIWCQKGNRCRKVSDGRMKMSYDVRKVPDGDRKVSDLVRRLSEGVRKV